MKTSNWYWYVLVSMLALLTSGIGLLAYTGPGDRSSVVTGQQITVLVCESTQYDGGPVSLALPGLARHMSAPAGSPRR